MTAEVLVRAGEVAVVATALTLALLVVGHTVLHTRGGRRWVAVGAVLLVYAAMAVPGLAPLWFAAFPLVAATFPDGRLTPRWLALPLVVCVVLTALELASGGAWSDLPWWPWFAMSQVLLLVGPVVRYRRRATTAERVAVRWVLLGILLTLAGYAATQAAFGAIGTGGPGARLGASLAILPVMLGLAVGLVAPAAVDVDAALHAVTATLLAVGALTLVVLAVPAETWVRVVAVSLLGAPAALAARRAADWLVYRGRPDPQRAVDRMLARLSTPTGHDDAARVVLEAVVDAAYLAGGRISGDWFDAVETGTPGVAIRSRVDFRGEPLATLELAPRRGESDLTRRDRRVVAALVAQAAPSLEAARTLAALQESRTRVVAAREEERRRLRRELHDDLGPTLSGIALSASALATTTGSADAAELHREIRQAVARSRELAYGLRPPVLDDHGLVAAVHDRVGGPDLRLEAPEVLDLPAAVDLAALRITQEAVTNARRHAPGSTVRVLLRVEAGCLLLDVDDDGPGLPAEVRAGVGMHALAERAAEVGGSARYDRTGPGCRLRVALPLDAP